MGNIDKVGSVLSVIPAAPSAIVVLQRRKESADEEWEPVEFPLIGWAVVVVSLDILDANRNAYERKTEVQPLMLIDGLPTTLSGLSEPVDLAPVDLVQYRLPRVAGGHLARWPGISDA